MRYNKNIYIYIYKEILYYINELLILLTCQPNKTVVKNIIQVCKISLTSRGA